jgi:hypothetical protein
VDIDLNYTGTVAREGMLEAAPRAPWLRCAACRVYRATRPTTTQAASSFGLPVWPEALKPRGGRELCRPGRCSIRRD